MIRILLVCSFCIFLSGCGGRGGGDSKPSPPTSPPPVESQPVITDEQRRRRLGQLEIGFFYADMKQFGDTAGWNSYAHIPTMMDFDKWGDQSYGFQLMRAAVQAGFTRLIVSLGGFGFASIGQMRAYREADSLRADLRAWFTAMRDAGLLQYLWGIYTADEPNKPDERISNSDMLAFCSDVVAIATEYGIAPQLWTIYGGQNDDRPGIGAHDVVGIDDYGRGIGVLEQYDRLVLKPTQRIVLVPQTVTMDGRGPESPDVWITAALSRANCLGIMAFDWCGAEGDKYPGLRDAPAELRQAWIDAGQEIINAKEQSA